MVLSLESCSSQKRILPRIAFSGVIGFSGGAVGGKSCAAARRLRRLHASAMRSRRGPLRCSTEHLQSHAFGAEPFTAAPFLALDGLAACAALSPSRSDRQDGAATRGTNCRSLAKFPALPGRRSPGPARWTSREGTANLRPMAFRLLHTADWQLGMKATAAGAAAPAVRAARLAAARRVVALANQHAVDVLLLAGDTFEDTTVPPVLVQQTVDLLRESRAPVFVLPANHDPLVPGGLFDHPAWRDAAPRVTVLRESGPIAVGAADLFACPLVAAHSVADPLARLPT
ncbi:MAG: hypothetical protein FJ293_07355, partial [Planctomycetes bacterium]|nr:hypothetical protein [Planctomycetota bacterium]